MGETRAMWYLVVWLFLGAAPWAVHVEGCSSRWFPCSRPSPATPPPPDLLPPGQEPLPGQEQSVLTTSPRPTVVIETKECPEMFNDWYCLNGGKCFMVDKDYYCSCNDGYEGVRCEHKYVDAESVLASLRAADIRHFVTAMGPLLLVAVILAIFVWRVRNKKKLDGSTEGGDDGGGGGDEVDGPAPPPKRVPFGPRPCENPPMELMVPPRVPRVPVRRSTSVSLQGAQAQRANNL